jgi:hypothetical protein
MRVHFASGEHPFPDPWLNVDRGAHWPQLDQTVDLLGPLPGNLDGIEWAYIGHFLEHITPDEGTDLLKRIRERMAPGGRLMVVGPDAAKGEAWHAAGRIGDDLLYAIRAHGEPDGTDRTGCHLWDCTGDAVLKQAELAGWSGVEEFPLGELPSRYPEVPVISLVEWQFAVTAHA